MWIQTYSGIEFDLFRPSSDKILIEDIAHHLSLLCRFTGACREFYSVAEHSIMVSSVLPAEYRLEGLLHDATEAYIGDMSSPVKNLSSMSGFRTLESEIRCPISIKFDLQINVPLAVRDADFRMLETERLQLMRPAPASWFVEAPEPYSVLLSCWSPEEAERKYLEMYDSIQ